MAIGNCLLFQISCSGQETRTGQESRPALSLIKLGQRPLEGHERRF